MMRDTTIYIYIFQRIYIYAGIGDIEIEGATNSFKNGCNAY